MSLSKIQSIITYKSERGGESYFFDIIIDEFSNISVRNIRSPLGLITDSMTSVPDEVVQDIQDAISLTQFFLGESQVISGTESFTGQTSISVNIPVGTLNNTNYRVQTTSSDGTLIKIDNKTVTGFDLIASTSYGSVGDPKDVDWAVFVSTAQSSMTGGELVFEFSDNSQRQVTFANSLATDEYRVLVEPSGFFPVRIENKTETGFTVSIGIELQNNGEQVEVGYDVIS